MAALASYVKYDEMTPWAIRLDSVTKNEAEGSYTVKLVQLASGKSTRVARGTTCVLQERPDGTMYFKSILHAYPTSVQSIVIDGQYQKLSPTRLNISSTDKEWPLHVLASFDGKVFAHSDNGKEGSAVLGILEDGRVVFSYYFENTGGLGVTEKQFPVVIKISFLPRISGSRVYSQL